MKKLVFIAGVVLFAACNNSTSTTKTMADTTKVSDVPMEKLEYPYTLDEPYKNWQPGDQKHAVTVMKMLKAWETKNFAECASYFGDSVQFAFDYYHQTLPHDSLMGVLNASWANFDSVKIKMNDWESVISEDKKDEWVTLWYKQIMVDKKGKTDSVSMVNDAKIVNGKIVVFDEKEEHYEAAKK